MEVFSFKDKANTIFHSVHPALVPWFVRPILILYGQIRSDRKDMAIMQDLDWTVPKIAKMQNTIFCLQSNRSAL